MTRRRRRNPESRSERSRAAKLGWRRRRHNPESRSERSRAARAGWAHRRRRHRNPWYGHSADHSAAARKGWSHRRRRRNPFYGHSAEHRRIARMESRSERSRAARKGWAHRRRHRNPFGRRRRGDFMGGIVSDLTADTGIVSDLTAAGIGGAAAVGVDVIAAYLPLPTTFQSGWGKVGINVVLAIALGWGVGEFVDKRTGTMVAVGALAVTAYNAIKMALGPTLGSSVKGLSGLADFQDFSAYMNPAAVLDTGAPAALPAPGGHVSVAGLDAYMEQMAGMDTGMGM